ncbi:MAG: CPBP family intramembrane glutamic endopeptidase [Bacteroidales bacterium]
MGNGPLQDTGAFTKLIFSAFIVISSFLVTLVGGLFLAIPLFDMGFMDLVDSLSNIAHPDYINLFKYFQIIQSIGLFVIPPFILGWFFGGNAFKYLDLNKGVGWRTIILTTVLMLAAIPIINLIAHYNTRISLPESMSSLEEWMKRTEEAANNLIEMFLKAETPATLLLNLFMIALIPAVGEELLFRGIIQRLFSEWTRNRHMGIWIAAILFSAMHIQFLGFIPRVLLGVLFGYLLIWSGRMWVPILAHFVNNATAVVVYYFINKNQISESVETIGAEKGDWAYALFSLLFFLFFIIVFYLREKKGYRL